MKKFHAFAGAAAALALMIAAPLSIAQTETPTTPPTAEQPATPPASPSATTPSTPSTPTTPAPSATPTDPNPVSPTSPPDQMASSSATAQAEPQGCRTRKAEDEACACLSDPSRIGVATAHSAGHNVCVRPE